MRNRPPFASVVPVVPSRRLAIGSLLGFAAATLAFGGRERAAVAESPELATPESRAQIAQAVQALEPFLTSLAGASRPIARGAPGTLEHAILAYAPKRPWAVAEGTLPAARPGGCPPEMASVGGRFCVDRWEGSLAVRGEGGALEPWPHHQTPAADRVYVARSAPGVLPQAYVSGAQAEAACKQAGKRLCQPV